MHRVGVLLDEVPLVDDQHACLALFMRIPCNANILLAQAFAGIANDQHHVRSANRGERANHAVAFDGLVLYAALSADARGIYDGILASIAGEVRVDGIACRTGDVADDCTLLAQQCIDQAALADVGFAYHGDIDAFGVRLLDILRKIFDDGIQKIA